MWPQLTNIESEIVSTIKSRKNTKVASKLNPWARIISGAQVSGVQGLVIQSVNDFKLFTAAGQNKGSIYGNKNTSGALGYDLKNLNAIAASGEQRAFRPSPIVQSITCKEGTDQISRELEISVKCFSLDQMELLQSFLMEPGYNLCVEWGWNTAEALSELIDVNQGLKDTLKSIANRCLNQDNIHKARVSSKGHYDIFLGFIVGGTVSSEEEAFILNIRCKGAPGLPTFLQTHKKTQELDKSGKVIQKPTVHPFPPSQTTNDKDTGVDTVRKRRFKSMFNALPAEKQIKEIKDLVDTQIYTMYDFINFDEVQNEQLTTYENSGTGAWDFLNVFGNKNIEVGNATLKKEGIFPDYKYISMELCAKILNTNGVLEKYTISGKEVKVSIDISKSVIGAFPYMFSIKPDKLIIPGLLPPFYEYFLNTKDVEQSANGVISGQSPVDLSLGSDGSIRFPQNTELPDGYGYNEEANYWGYLKHLYVNFDVLYSKMNQPNKNIREVFLDILNEVSTGANSFWNFQIVENKTSEGNIILTVVDENWVGNSKKQEQPVNFVHNGIDSAFIAADLDVSIPADMTNAVISRRLAIATNPQSAIVNTGELFNSELDLFMKEVTLSGTESTTPPQPPAPEVLESETQAKAAETYQQQIDALEKQNNDLSVALRERNIEFNKTHSYGEQQADIRSTDPNHIRNKTSATILENNKTIGELKIARNEASKKAEEAAKKEKEDKEKEEQSKLTMNFNKICIVANPFYARLGTLSTAKLKDKATFGPSGVLRCYTLQDGNYFDRLRNDAFNPKGTGSNTRLSHPLPITYTFTILGCSGIRRGDMFNVLGIPSKYRKHGLFQVTQVEHNLTDMEWKTTITGKYRQKNS